MHLITFKDKIQIARSPEEIWRFLQSPAVMKDWNPKIRAVVPVSLGEPSEGCIYRLRYEMIGKESNFLAELMEYKEPSRLLIHLTGGCLPRRGYMQHIYELTANAEGTSLQQQIDIYTSPADIFSGYLAASGHCISRLSKKRYLMNLKRLAENS